MSSLKVLLSTFVVFTLLVACRQESHDSQVVFLTQDHEVAVMAGQPLAITLNDLGASGATFSQAGDPAFGRSWIENNTLYYQADDDHFGGDSFSFILTKDGQSASAHIWADVGQTLVISGRVTEHRLRNSDIHFRAGDIQSTSPVDGRGFYRLEVPVLPPQKDEIPQLSVTQNNDARITLTSRLHSIETLVQWQIEHGEINRHQEHGVQISPVANARDVLLDRLAALEEAPITRLNLDRLDRQLDPDIMLEMAALTVLLIQDPSAGIDTQHQTLYDVLASVGYYNQLVAEFAVGGQRSPLMTQLNYILNDDEVMPLLEPDALFGDYLQMFETTVFKPDFSSRYLSISESTLFQSTGAIDTPETRGRFNNANYDWNLEGSIIEITNSIAVPLQLTVTPGRHIADPQIRANFIERFGENYSTQRTVNAQLQEFRVISRYGDRLMLREVSQMEVPEFTITDDFGSFTVPDYSYVAIVNLRLVNAESEVSEFIPFNDVTARDLILPDVLGYFISHQVTLESDGTVSFANDDLLEEFGAAFFVTNLDWQLTWALHDDDERLRLTLRMPDDTLVNQADYFILDDTPGMENMYMEYTNGFDEFHARVNPGGAIPEATITAEDVIEMVDSGLMLHATVNANIETWDGLEPRPFGWFGWQFFDDGTGVLPQFTCDGAPADIFVCRGDFRKRPNVTDTFSWEVIDSEIRMERVTSAPCPDSGPCLERRIRPLLMLTDEIVYGIEMNIGPSSFIGQTEPVVPFLQIQPRFMSWRITDLSEIPIQELGMQSQQYLRVLPSTHADLITMEHN
ncbi:MAG: hypothetical protein JJU10_00580 [Idiomarina sp.]|nr:hypothetical protein [Idiomarina sp.]